MKGKKIAIHFTCWTVFLVYYYIGRLIDPISSKKAFLYTSMTLIQIIEFYICYLWVYPRYLKVGRGLQLLGGVGVAMVVFIVMRYSIEEIFYPRVFGFRNYEEGMALQVYIRDNLYYGTSYILISAAIWSTEQGFKNERRQQQLKDEAIKTELSFLKSQINPHFLYNTLNYIYSLAIPVSDQLSSAVLRLSDLMRYNLTESTDGKVSLIKEVEYLQSYIELFRMRFDPNFFIEFKTEGINDQHKLASLLLIPFVENAFKHGVVNKAESPVHIELTVKDKKLYFSVYNVINNHQKDKSSGIGLANIERRLTLIYPGRHHLNIVKTADTYHTKLTIDL